MTMRIGCATWHMGVHTLTESIEKAIECGARAVSFHLTPQKHQLPEEADKILELVESCDLDVTCHNELGRLEEENDPLPRLQDEVDDILEWHAACGRVRCVSFDPASHRMRPEEEPSVDIARTVERLKYVADRLGRRGIKTAIENWLGNSRVEDFERIKDGVGNDDLGALVDLGHLNIAVNTGLTGGVPAEEFIRRLPMPIHEVHIHYNNGKDDQHAPLQGHSIVIEQAVRALAERDFAGIATIEHSSPDGTLDAVRNSMNIFGKLFARHRKDSQ